MNVEQLKGKLFFSLSDFEEGFIERVRDLDRWSSLCNRFEIFHSSCETPASRPIPRLIHQIWLGGPLPREYREWTTSWERINKGWEYKLWDEKLVLKFGLVNERAFKKSPSRGAQSDIARYEILLRLGGIYADTDFECLRPFDQIARTCSFFAGTVFSDSPVLNNALMGAAPGHQILSDLTKDLSLPVKSKGGMQVLAQSGPYFLTEHYFALSDSLGERDVVFPSSYFYPLPNYAPFRGLTAEMRKEYVRTWSLAIHYWEGSWMKPHPLRAFLSRVKNCMLQRRPATKA